MTRVLILSSAYFPIIGGAETYASNLYRGLTSRDIEVAVFTNDASVAAFRPANEAIRAHEYRRLLAASDKVEWEQMYFSLLPELERIVDEFRPDVLHANSHETAILASMAGLAKSMPVVATFHEQSPERSSLGQGRCAFVYRHLPLSAIVAGSEYYYDKAIRFGADPARVVLIRHGVDTRKFRPGKSSADQRTAWDCDHQQIVVLCAARISPRKGQIELVEAFEKVSRSVPDARLVLAGNCHSGSSDYLNVLRGRIGELGLGSRIILDAQLTLDDMPRAYAASDIVVQPSHEEGLGLALLEAMASGRCVVGTDVVGIREVLKDPSVGRRVPAKDAAALSRVLINLCRDPEARLKFGTAARAYIVEHFTLDRMAESTHNLYQRLLNERKLQPYVSVRTENG